MNNSTSRGTRSRISSPYVSAPNNTTSGTPNAGGDSAGGSKLALGSWQEPDLAPPLPSFAEHGIERHGVVANMAPLGTRPTAKILKQANTKESDPLRRGATIKKFYAQISDTPYSTYKDSASTPEPGASLTRQGSVSSRGEDGPQAQASPQQHTTSRKSLPRATIQDPAQRAWLNVFAVEPVQASPPLNPQAKPPVVSEPPTPVVTNEPTPAETDRVVELAVQEAIHAHRWPTAYALRTLFDDNNDNPRIVRLIEMIFTGRASEAQTKEFQAIMREKKREGSQDNTAHYYFNGDGAETEQTPVPQPPPRQLSTPATAVPVYNLPYPLAPVVLTNIFQQSQPKPYKSVYGSTPPSLNVNTSTGIALSNTTALQRPSPGHSSGSGSTAVSPHGIPHSEHPSKKHKGNSYPGMEGNKGAKGDGNAAPNGLGASTTAPPRARSRSSSLSSVPDEEVYLTSDTEDAGPDLPVATSKPKSSHGKGYKHSKGEAKISARNDTDVTQPSAQPKSKGPMLYNFSTDFSTSKAAPPQTNNSATPDSTALASPTRKSRKTSKNNKKEMSKVNEVPPYDPNDRLSRAKRKAKDKTNYAANIEASYERHQLPETEDSDAVDSVPAPPPKRPRVRLLNTKHRSSSRLNQDESGMSSPSLLPSHLDVAPGSLSTSRAGTPNVQGRATRKGGRPGSGLRVKSSPMKKKGGGPIAGLPKGGGDRNSPTVNGVQNPEDNDDFCSACSGNGTLVCCDGCVRAYHYKCCDPPIDEDNEPDEYWCNRCANQRELPPMDEDKGIFESLLTNLNFKNPSAFSLTKQVREYFSEVRTGPEGEYESGAAKQKARGNEIAKEPTDFFKLGDGKGKAILCYHCRKPATSPDRAIIPCSYCNLYWHMDCLDPPRAREPAQGQAWRCPVHVDDLLQQVNSMGPAHRHRRIKNQEVITPLFPRGHKNDGHIEVELEDSDLEQETGFYEQREFGHVYKLPEKAIKLDFITQVRKKFPGKGYFPRPQPEKPRSADFVEFDRRPLEEQQAALNLAQLTSRSFPASGDGTQNLINTLIANAPPVVFQSMAQVDATELSKQLGEKKLGGKSKAMLVALRAFIDRQIEEAGDEGEEPAHGGDVHGGDDMDAEEIANATTATEGDAGPSVKVDGVVDEDMDMLLD